VIFGTDSEFSVLITETCCDLLIFGIPLIISVRNFQSELSLRVVVAGQEGNWQLQRVEQSSNIPKDHLAVLKSGSISRRKVVSIHYLEKGNT
jgi:hypothetical protein